MILDESGLEPRVCGLWFYIYAREDDAWGTPHRGRGV